MIDEEKQEVNVSPGLNEGEGAFPGQMRNFVVRDIPVDSYFSLPVYLDEDFIVAAPEMAFSSDLIETLKAWDFREVFSDGEPRERSDAETAVGEAEEEEDDEEPSGQEQYRGGEEFYDSLYRYVETLFARATLKEALRFTAVAEKVSILLDYMKGNQISLLRAMKRRGAEKSLTYLASHALNSAIYALIIGMHLKLPDHRMLELGTAALLHEIGMVRLPPEVYIHGRPLSPPEQKLIRVHPVLGFSVLQSFEFPLNVCLAALEHQERENGEGYPRGLGGEKIGLYAKIIAVACSYEALTGSRPHRQALDGNARILDLLQNKRKQYDDAILRVLMFSLSLYPAGLHVLLSNGKKGVVVEVNPENPGFPVVQIRGELTPEGGVKTLQTSPGDVVIIRPLLREEIAAP
jgi:HD-GYP domain-containing protein (c-di-GMP phosphodiesterase class II)